MGKRFEDLYAVGEAILPSGVEVGIDKPGQGPQARGAAVQEGLRYLGIPLVNDFLTEFNTCKWRFQAVRIGYTYLLPSKIAQSISI